MFDSPSGELVAPAVLEARGSGRFQEAQMQFLLSMQQANLIASNRYTELHGSSREYLTDPV